ncbi:hypothetical protein HRG_004019 [Hirsutella rhossiliensis]|uniref:Uncharacterized protein n=1 Tax=Hirsutella rhossiliensis TaxID=111463 RepID=A0A9P8SK58_9HYPO|nr:uncharacterized protein HRG_04019 [Hirsutella rhossiliensis]KAH0966003.1 hypothetical protein HRG_04019 [Hirsutella rhossiliensis]
MLNSGGYDYCPGGVRGDMVFSESYYHQSGRTFDPNYFPEVILPRPEHNAEGPLLPPSTGYAHWLHEAEGIKRRASLMMTAAPTWSDGEPATSAAIVADGSLGSYSPDWWCHEQQQQHNLHVQEQAALMPAASWDPFGQTDIALSIPWPTYELPGADTLAASTVAPPLVLQDVSYPCLDGVEGSSISPYPETEMGLFTAPAKSWLDSSPSYFFPQPVSQPLPPFWETFSSPLGSWSSGASLSGMSEESDLEGQFPCALSLSKAGGSAGGVSGLDPSLPCASSSPAMAFSGREGKASAKSKSPSTRTPARRSRKRLPSIAPEIPPVMEGRVSRVRRSNRLSSKMKAQDRSPSSSICSDSDPASSAPSVSPASSTSQQPKGTRFGKIDDMDPVTKTFVETMLLNDRAESRDKKVPYSIILRKLSHVFSGAEETLRGHRRKLMLPKEQRVRRPVWEPYDILLLQEAVQYQHHTSLRRKISWTAVSRYIYNNGGSYKFGITACSRKWRLLQAGQL